MSDFDLLIKNVRVVSATASATLDADLSLIHI